MSLATKALMTAFMALNDAERDEFLREALMAHGGATPEGVAAASSEPPVGAILVDNIPDDHAGLWYRTVGDHLVEGVRGLEEFGGDWAYVNAKGELRHGKEKGVVPEGTWLLVGMKRSTGPGILMKYEKGGDRYGVMTAVGRKRLPTGQVLAVSAEAKGVYEKTKELLEGGKA